MPPWARQGMRKATDAARRMRALAAGAGSRLRLGAVYVGQCIDILWQDTAAFLRAGDRWVTRIGAITLSEIWNAPQRLALRGLIGLFAILAPVTSAPPPPPRVQEAITPQGPWILVWNDEFDGNALDRTKWAVQTTEPNEEPFGDSLLQDNPETISVADGVLRMSARPIGPNRYSGAFLETQGLAAWRYGRFEARIKVAKGAGTLTSFWMLHKDPTLEKWPLGGELDILEQLGRDPNFTESVIHFKGVDRERNWARRDMREPVGDAFHDFALEWTPEGFFWFIDGELVLSYPPHDAHPFNRPFYLILSLCVGGDWARSPKKSTVFPVVTEVDWVRVYAINPDYVRPDSEASATVAQQGVAAIRAPSGL